jgi:conjugative relaxase-like TrwC/TraI family protein
MVRHKHFRSGMGNSGAARYFTEHLSVSCYYSNGMGLLQGQTFERMRLPKREIDLQIFRCLEKNVHPITGERLTPQTNTVRREWALSSETGEKELVIVSDRRTGLDLPMIVPKTVSEVVAENPNEFGKAILKTFVDAKDKAMLFAESLAKTRVRIGGKNEDRVTGNLLYFSVIHYDARPVGAAVPDPMVHAHNYIFNLTWDPIEKRLKSLQSHDIIKRADTIDAVFLSELERGLSALGIGTERTADGRSFEITGVKGKDLFSKRRNEILKEEIAQRERIETLTRYRLHAAAKLGRVLDYDRVKTDVRNELGKQMAKRKTVISMEEKLEQLRAQMTPEIRASLQEAVVKSAPRINWRTPEEAKAEVLYSAFKQMSVVHELEIVGELLRMTGGAMTFDEAFEFAKGPAFIHLDAAGNVTTEAVKREEERMLQTARDGQDACEPMIPDPNYPVVNPQIILARDQLNATRFIFNSRDLVTDVSGIAGAGKTTLLKEVVADLRENGRSVILLAPTSASEKNLHKDFLEALTLQKFEADPELQRELKPGTAIILDEVSMVSVPQMCRLVALVKEKGCRLVTCGDSSQHVSPQRGDAIRILQDSGSVRSVQLIETFRAQVQYLKETVIDLKAGGDRRAIGYARLDKHGDIREVMSQQEMRQQAVETHLEAVRAGYIAILASPIHAEAREATAIVRETLKAEGKIEKVDHTVVRLARVAAEGPELRDPLHYQPGRVVVFHTKVRGGFKAGEKWRVMENHDWSGVKCFLLERDGVEKSFDPGYRGKWNVYDTAEMQLSVGDQVRITEGFKERGVIFKNNDIAKVAAIDVDRVTLDDGRSMRRDFLHLDQGVCITSYATQCRTVRQVVALCPLSSFAEMDAKTFYVLASRATHRAIFYTDCKEAFKEAVLRPGDRRSVWEYLGGKLGRVPDLIRQRPREQEIGYER